MHRRKRPAVALGAVVGCKLDPDAAVGQHRSQRLGGKQMAAGAAGSDQDTRNSLFPSC